MMRPTLSELPPSPEGRIGWPWTEESLPLPSVMSNGSKWPRISIVTPSYNQGQFIEETIRSVLLQGYPNLEYIILDGGSTDNSLDIIQKYSNFFTFWVSEKDEGQADAINKGFEKITGEITSFINSDDVYLPNALKFAAHFFLEHHECDFVCAQTMFIDVNSKHIKGFEELFMVEINNKTMTEGCHIAQPSTFFRAAVLQHIGFFSKDLHYSFDYEYWLRAFLRGFKFGSSKEIISLFRLHKSSKTVSDYSQGKFALDFIKIYRCALSNRQLSLLNRKGLYRGLGRAGCLLFINLESSSTTHAARLSFWRIILQNPEILVFSFTWKTLILSIAPVCFRVLWRKLRDK